MEWLKRPCTVHLFWLFTIFLGLLPASAPSAPAFSPSGPQKVLVVLADLGSSLDTLCPNVFLLPPCPAGIANNLAFYQPPRNSAQVWQQLLDKYLAQFWELASYGESQPQFTVLINPARSDGWWTPPHSAKDYWYNGNLFVDQVSWAETSDPASGAINAFCSSIANQSFCLNELPQFNRLLVMSNVKARGGVSNGDTPVPLTVSLSPLIVNLVTLPFTMTLANEDSTDSDALSVIAHEFGHQLGVPTHYGQCAPYNNIVVPANYQEPNFGLGFLECMGWWDVMGFDWLWPQPGGYSRWGSGWIDTNTTLSFELPTAQPFSQLNLIRPVEVAPSSGVSNLIRLSRGQLSDPVFNGYFVECRVRANGEGLYPNSSGIPREGLIITDVHEGSIVSGAKAYAHIVRPNFLFDTIATANLSPGQSFTDPFWQLKIRFNAWAGGDGADRLCDVEIDYQHPSLTGPIVLWQNRVSPGVTPSFGGSMDIGVNHPQQGSAVGGGGTAKSPLIVESLWPNHSNALFVRAHTLGTQAVANVTLNVEVTQPALVTSECGTPPSALVHQVVLPIVAPIEGGVGTVSFVPRRGSVGFRVIAPAEPASAGASGSVATSRLAFEYFSPGAPQTQWTRFRLKTNAGCSDRTTFTVLPRDVPDGWALSVSPRFVSLAPGESADIAAALSAPPGAHAGDHAEIAIDVQTAEPSDLALDPGVPIDTHLSVHEHSIGAIQLMAKVVDEGATVRLRCARSTRAESSLSVVGQIVPPTPDANVMLEYRSRNDTETRFVSTDANGVFRDSVAPYGQELQRVQAFWPGDAIHAPAQSTVCRLAGDDHADSDGERGDPD